MAEISCTFEGSTRYSAAIRVNIIGRVPTTGRIAYQDPILGALIADSIENTVDGFVLVHVGSVDVTRRELVDLLNLLGFNSCAHYQSEQQE
jgi:hypothetical protein